MHSPAIHRRDRWNQNMFSPAIHCRVGIRPPCRGFNPMHSPVIYRWDRWNQNMFSPAIHCRDWESALCVGVSTPCIARRFIAGIGIAPIPPAPGLNPVQDRSLDRYPGIKMPG